MRAEESRLPVTVSGWAYLPKFSLSLLVVLFLVFVGETLIPNFHSYAPRLIRLIVFLGLTTSVLVDSAWMLFRLRTRPISQPSRIKQLPVVSLCIVAILFFTIIAESLIPGFHRYVPGLLPEISLFGLITGVLIDSIWMFRAHARSIPQPYEIVKAQILSTVHGIFELVSLVVPNRVAKEDVGEAIEIILTELNHQRPTWRIWLKVGSTLFWIFSNARKELMANFSDKNRD